jgi:hypothetical protein
MTPTDQFIHQLRPTRPRRIGDTLARGLPIVAATLFFLWPALWNGFPLLFSDTLAILGQGHAIVGKLAGRFEPTWLYDSSRPEIFSASLVFLHRGAALWPIVVVQAGLLAWTLWLVFRALCPRRPVILFLLLTAVLAAVTEVAWYASFVMPDIWGALFYLSFYLLVFVPGSLQRWERLVLAAVALWAITAHSSYLLIGILLCVLFLVAWRLRWPVLRGHGRQIAFCLGIILLAVAAQETVHWRLYGRASLFGHAPPFLMARLLGDGPARLYLEQNCATSSWFLCSHLAHLPTSDGEFLWDRKGIWLNATPAQQEQMRREQIPLLLATLRAYPVQQIAISTRNVLRLLVTLGPIDFENAPDFTPQNLDYAAQDLSLRYRLTPQSRNQMPQAISQRLQLPMLAVSALIVLLLLPWAWHKGELRLLGLASVIVVALLANAVLSGVLACVCARYEGRLAWMLALLAGLLLAACAGLTGVADVEPVESRL